ncbi:Zn(II)2Cys6 transcription factor domain-containing protein SCDLUD_005098 [Saccharomycodes ludwigii]|uniref:Zn(II)2Cys6 transcription factor domain-containing protein n=1 Tax=Saccharomycodes ludwigii TaxID=36035 RepID=UPI001E8A034F|nr:hypothetical protein SCDLUD_005098 [Saccharomycodes ludwigii]KAH3898763.1 hypothetical protein SCDLUD_005098 [Saccharomycodes ludwigii]
MNNNKNDKSDLTLKKIRDSTSGNKRVNKACDDCRKRKIKCTELDPVLGKCTNCIKLDVDCTFYHYENMALRRKAKRQLYLKDHTIKELEIKRRLEKVVGTLNSASTGDISEILASTEPLSPASSTLMTATTITGTSHPNNCKNDSGSNDFGNPNDLEILEIKKDNYINHYSENTAHLYHDNYQLDDILIPNTADKLENKANYLDTAFVGNDDNTFSKLTESDDDDDDDDGANSNTNNTNSNKTSNNNSNNNNSNNNNSNNNNINNTNNRDSNINNNSSQIDRIENQLSKLTKLVNILMNNLPTAVGLNINNNSSKHTNISGTKQLCNKDSQLSKQQYSLQKKHNTEIPLSDSWHSNKFQKYSIPSKQPNSSNITNDDNLYNHLVQQQMQANLFNNPTTLPIKNCPMTSFSCLSANYNYNLKYSYYNPLECSINNSVTTKNWEQLLNNNKNKISHFAKSFKNIKSKFDKFLILKYLESKKYNLLNYYHINNVEKPFDSYLPNDTTNTNNNSYRYSNIINIQNSDIPHQEFDSNLEYQDPDVFQVFRFPPLNKCKRLIEIFNKSKLGTKINYFQDADMNAILDDIFSLDRTHNKSKEGQLIKYFTLNIVLCLSAYIYRSTAKDDFLVRKDKIVFDAFELYNIELKCLCNSTYYFRMICICYESWRCLKPIYLFFTYCSWNFSEEISHNILATFLNIAQRLGCNRLLCENNESPQTYMAKVHLYWLAYMDNVTRTVKWCDIAITNFKDTDLFTDFGILQIMKVFIVWDDSFPSSLVKEVQSANNVQALLNICHGEIKLFPICILYCISSLTDIITEIYGSFFIAPALLNYNFDQMLDKFIFLQGQLNNWEYNLPNTIKLEHYKQSISLFCDRYKDHEERVLTYGVFVERIEYMNSQYNYIHCVLAGFILNFIQDNKKCIVDSRHDVDAILEHSIKQVKKYAVENVKSLSNIEDLSDIGVAELINNFFIGFNNLFCITIGSDPNANETFEYVKLIAQSFNQFKAQFAPLSEATTITSTPYNTTICFMYSFIIEATDIVLKFYDYDKCDDSVLQDIIGTTFSDIREASKILNRFFEGKKEGLLKLEQLLYEAIPIKQNYRSVLTGDLLHNGNRNDGNIYNNIHVDNSVNNKAAKLACDKLPFSIYRVSPFHKQYELMTKLSKMLDLSVF